MRALVVLGLVFPYQAKRLAWGASPKWRILCCVGRKTLTQSILTRGAATRLTCIMAVKCSPDIDVSELATINSAASHTLGVTWWSEWMRFWRMVFPGWLLNGWCCRVVVVFVAREIGLSLLILLVVANYPCWMSTAVSIRINNAVTSFAY